LITTVLVSGASIAGLTTAYWLGRQGYSVTVVERCDGPRPGGQAIDVRGPALSILERMGLLQAAEDKKTRMRGASFVDRDATFRDYVERNQRLVDDDEGLDGSPIAPDEFYRVVHSIELKDY
jgi:2-polyprenyl-6-methoxyphenol hydroxylase-like FAD-dependent oxidoreductase